MLHAAPDLLGVQSGKIQAAHLERLAVVYVRQSTAQQVLDNQESTRLQYGLADRARLLGWARERVLVIDDDLGKSGATAVGRAGFARLVSEVGLDHVGLILGIEMSRLARSNRDWHQLLEICALFRTLIADADGVYDPGQYNDRLLLGLKGTMSEAELHILGQRMLQGKLNKARRGELGFTLPIGYVRRATGEVVFDPDEQAQAGVRLIFRKFQELGTVNAVLRYLVQHEIQLGIRARSGPTKGELQWCRPVRPTVQGILKNPIYAGAYAYGRRQLNMRRRQAGQDPGRVNRPASEWHALIKDHHPVYISWAEYEQNQAHFKANQARHEERGAVRGGCALLGGVLHCGRCGQKMSVAYASGGRHSYRCARAATEYGDKLCQSLTGAKLDESVSQQVLAALQPAALELSLAAASQVEQERSDLNHLWLQRLERAEYEAQRSARHYQLVEPENRLVARQLAREWEEKLGAHKQLQEEYDRHNQQQPRELSSEERTAIRQLASDIPALWNAETTTHADRKEIIRQVIDQVSAEVIDDTERVRTIISWTGGMQTKAVIIRPVRKLEQLSYYPQLCERVQSLAASGLNAASIAVQLNTEGFRPPKRHDHFGVQGIRPLLERLGITQHQYRNTNEGTGLAENQWWLPELALRLGIPRVTLYNWAKKGLLQAEQQPGPRGRWIIHADETEQQRLRERHAKPDGYHARQAWLNKRNQASRKENHATRPTE